MSVTDLPLVNAVLNGTCALLLVIGYRFIRAGRATAHRTTMLAAFTVSVLFLVSYLVYHVHVGSTVYARTGLLRAAYLTILLTHTVLAALVPPLAVWTLVLGLRGRFDAHRRLARWTLPIWLYVSVTGVVIYVMLYPLGGAQG